MENTLYKKAMPYHFELNINDAVEKFLKFLGSLFVAGGFLTKLLQYHIAKKHKAKDKEELRHREIAIESLSPTIDIVNGMKAIIHNTPVDLFFIIRGSDSGSIPDPTKVYYIKPLHQENKSEKEKDITKKYKNMEVDAEYIIRVILELLRNGVARVELKDLPNCFLKRAMMAEGLNYIEYRFLKQTSNGTTFFTAACTRSLTERFQSPSDAMTIETETNTLRQIFKRYN